MDEEMADHSRKPKHKRQCKSGHKIKAKHRKPTEIEESRSIKTMDATDVKAITNICNELLEQIFNFLDPDSLLNVAGTCKRLQIAAAANFGLRFGRNFAILYSKRQNYRFEWSIAPVPKKGFRSIVRAKTNGFYVYGPTILPFLRCFGAHTSRLHGYNLTNYEIQYVNRYCADTLTEITLRNVDKEALAIESIEKPFRIVEHLLLDSDGIPLSGEQFSKLVYWFPNLQSLHLFDNCMGYDFPAVSFPNLHKLWIGGRNDSYFKEKYIKRLLRANEQLRCFKLATRNLPISMVLDMTSKQKLISKLGFCVAIKRYTRTTQLMRLAKQHPMVVELDLGFCLIKADDAIALISKLSLLTYIRFRVKDRTEYVYLLNQLQNVIRFEVKFANFIDSKIQEVNLKINQRL